MSYSQNNEEALILEAVGSTVGRFLDIGAHDGAYLSNTMALVERGWSGVLVEANPALFTRLVDHYGSIHRLALVNAAIGLEYRISRLWPATRDDALSTTEEAQRIAREAQASFSFPFWVSMIPLAALLAQFPLPVDVLSIDTEGTSVDLFLAWPFDHYRPKVICVEHDGRIDEVLTLAQSVGYSEAGRNAENLVLVR